MLILAALKRAERHTGRVMPGARYSEVVDHLGLPMYAGTGKRLRSRFRKLEGRVLDAHPVGAIVTSTRQTESYCSECSAPVIAACPKCNARILAASQYGAIPEKPENYFCFFCGAPYPWADRESLIMQMRNMLAFEPGLDDAPRLEVAEQIAVRHGPMRTARSESALGRLSARAARPVLQTLVSAELRKQLGLPLA